MHLQQQGRQAGIMKRRNKTSVFVFVFMLLLFCICCNSCHGETMKPEIRNNSSSNSSKVERVMLSILLGSITGLGCALVCAFLLRFIFQYMRKVPILKGPVVFSPQISPKSLQSALANIELIKGKYYKTTLLLDHEDGFTVAVKKLDTTQPATSFQMSKRRRMIQSELEILAGLKHRHVMSLRAYVVGPDDGRFCLVYDYVATGSLEDAMKRNVQIGWDARLRIAVGIVKGLQYLHFTCTPRVLHFNLKPSNVLLDAEFEPRLGDCGLAHTFDDGIRRSEEEEAEGCCYYYAPECFPNFSIYTEKSDIFSFGVILGMLLTGRDPSDPLFSGGGMGMWFRQVVEAGDGREALDKTLLGHEMEEDEMLMAVRIAAVCLSDMPADRPSSDELVPMLTQLHSF